MKRLGYVYEVSVELEFTRAEVKTAIECSTHHYDARCRAASVPGPGAFLNALHIRGVLHGDPAETRAVLSIGELDILVKILEPWQPRTEEGSAVMDLYLRCVAELKGAIKARAELNLQKRRRGEVD